MNRVGMDELTHIELTIDGNRIRDIPSFYMEINSVFMSGEEWQLGPSLDALSMICSTAATEL